MKETDFNNKIVFEVGSGSGVLGIYALILRARQVVGIEVEGLAVDSSNENLELNRKYHGFSGTAEFLEDDFSWIERNPDFAYDIFLSNILPDIFYKNEKNFLSCLSKAKIWILSGIIVEKREEFLRWLTPKVGGRAINTREKEGWVVFYNF